MEMAAPDKLDAERALVLEPENTGARQALKALDGSAPGIVHFAHGVPEPQAR